MAEADCSIQRTMRKMDVKDPSELRGKIYRKAEHIKRDIKNGKFDFKKSVCLKNGRLYFACYE